MLVYSESTRKNRFLNPSSWPTASILVDAGPWVATEHTRRNHRTHRAVLATGGFRWLALSCLAWDLFGLWWSSTCTTSTNLASERK